MALILHLETATTVCSVAIGRDGKLLALKEQGGDYSHSENLTLFVQDVCKQADVELSSLDAIAVSKGPGSYTGLRIGVSTAKGLCYALNKPLIAINTLQHMAFAMALSGKNKFPENTLYCPMLDARRMEVYCAIYDCNNKELEPTSAKIIDAHSFENILNSNNVVFFGDGAAKCKSVLSRHSKAIFIDDVTPSAQNMLALANQAYLQNCFENTAYFEPFYLKDFMVVKSVK